MTPAELVAMIRSASSTDRALELLAEHDRALVAIADASQATAVALLRVQPHDRRVGMFFALEVKTATGRVRPEQTTWLELVRRMGGFAAVVRSVDEAKAALERARNGEIS